MVVAAGQIVRSTGLSQPFVVQAYATASLTQTTATAADITGATVTFTTVVPNVTALIQGVFDVTTTVTASVFAVGLCVVDGGTPLGAEAVWQMQTANTRLPITQVWTAVLATTGSHTIKLQGNLTSAAGTATFNASHTGITVTVFDF